MEAAIVEAKAIPKVPPESWSEDVSVEAESITETTLEDAETVPEPLATVAPVIAEAASEPMAGKAPGEAESCPEPLAKAVSEPVTEAAPVSLVAAVPAEAEASSIGTKAAPDEVSLRPLGKLRTGWRLRLNWPLHLIPLPLP